MAIVYTRYINKAVASGKQEETKRAKNRKRALNMTKIWINFKLKNPKITANKVANVRTIRSE